VLQDLIAPVKVEVRKKPAPTDPSNCNIVTVTHSCGLVFFPLSTGTLNAATGSLTKQSAEGLAPSTQNALPVEPA